MQHGSKAKKKPICFPTQKNGFIFFIHLFSSCLHLRVLHFLIVSNYSSTVQPESIHGASIFPHLLSQSLIPKLINLFFSTLFFFFFANLLKIKILWNHRYEAQVHPVSLIVLEMFLQLIWSPPVVDSPDWTWFGRHTPVYIRPHSCTVHTRAPSMKSKKVFDCFEPADLWSVI